MESGNLWLLVDLAGNKVNNIDVVYTPWQNLKKTPSMDVGQVGFYNSKMVSFVMHLVNVLLHEIFDGEQSFFFFPFFFPVFMLRFAP